MGNLKWFTIEKGTIWKVVIDSIVFSVKKRFNYFIVYKDKEELKRFNNQNSAKEWVEENHKKE